MTVNEKRSRLKKEAKRRRTPRDVAVEGTLAARVRAPRAPPRARTREETRADDLAPAEFARVVMDVGRWARVFRSELGEMNSGKVGRPYLYCDSMVAWLLSLMAVTGTSFRFVCGFADAVLGWFGLAAPSHSRLTERALSMHADAGTDAGAFGPGFLCVRACGNVTARVRRLAADSTGLTLSSVLGWRRRKWGAGPADRGWLKLHVLADVDSGEIVAYALTDETVGDGPVLRSLTEAARGRGHRFDAVYGDNAYCSVANWSHVTRDLGARFVTSFQSRTAPVSRGCMARGAAAALWCSLTYDEWTRVTGYGRRWKVECVNSDLKRLLGETVSARTRAGAVAEVAARIGAFDRYKAVRARIMGVTGNGVRLI